MAEPATLSVAGNIVQFVDFGVKLFSSSRKLHRSGKGSHEEDRNSN